MSANNTHRLIDVIREMVDLHNSTKHRSIKMTPVEASNPKNDDVIHHTHEWPKPKFSVGDRVRITKKHTVFKKSYLPLWTEELFEIAEI
jgi:hypothetical protein